MYISINQENVMFKILNTLEERNRQMDMMLQLMARQMGININLGDVNNGNNNNGGNDNNRGNNNGGRGNSNGPENNINGNNGHGNNGNEADNFRQVACPVRAVSSRPLLPIFPPRDPAQPVNEPQDQFKRD